MCIYKKYTSTHTLCIQKLLFWMPLIAINRLTALILTPVNHGEFVSAAGRPSETIERLLALTCFLIACCAPHRISMPWRVNVLRLSKHTLFFSLPIDLCDGCNVLTSTPAVLKRPSELATVTMWPWFISSILGRNALVVWKRKREGEGGEQRQLFCWCCSSLPKPFDPFFFPPPRLIIHWD